MTMTDTGVKPIAARGRQATQRRGREMDEATPLHGTPPEDGKPRNAVDEKWMQADPQRPPLRRYSLHDDERFRAKARKETIDGSEARH